MFSTETECEECGHPISLHGVNGCTRVRYVQIEGSSETQNEACGCEAHEWIEEAVHGVKGNSD